MSTIALAFCERCGEAIACDTAYTWWHVDTRFMCCDRPEWSPADPGENPIVGRDEASPVSSKKDVSP